MSFGAVRCFHRHVLLLMLVNCVSTQGQSVDLWLDEAIAGSDRNHSLLSSGAAIYHIRFQRPSASDCDAAVHLNGTRARFDLGSNRLLVMDTQYVEFDSAAVLQILNGAAPAEFSLFIRPSYKLPMIQSRIPVHLQAQGMDGFFPIADCIRAWRKRGLSIPVIPLGDGLYSIAVVDVERGVRSEFVVSSREGFCVLKYRWSPLKRPESPGCEMVTSFRELPNGAFISESGNYLTRSVDPTTNRPVLRVQHSYRLTSVSLEAPDDSIFTLEGLGVPTGVRIQDRIRGTEYRYGITPVRAEDIEIPMVYPADHTRHGRWIAPGVLVGIVLMLLGYQAWSRRPH